MSSPAQVFSAHLLAALSELEVTQVFLSPGSRSQSLAIAASQLHEAGKITLRVRIDERSMAFTALGASRATGKPVAIITTSGTAVANLHPAVLEAHHSGVPLILLTADRPAELRGVGANQATNQVGIFADAVRDCIDVPAPEEQLDNASVRRLAEQSVELALGSKGERPGPVQLNLCFREPLSSVEPNAAELITGATLSEAKAHTPSFAVLDGSKLTVVVAGAEAGFEALEAAEAFGWPILAEPSSRSRTGANAIIGYREILKTDTDLASRIERVIVYGKPTLSREIQKLIAREDIELVVIGNPRVGRFDPYGNAKHTVDEVSVSGEVSNEWLARWRVASHNWQSLQKLSGNLDRRAVIEAVYRSSEFNDSIVLGASRMVREADLWAPAKPIQVFSNRGLSGIDGTIATATGIALNAEGSFTRVILGDLAAIHDLGSLIEDPEEPISLQIIVVNDGGGTIFESLEVAGNVSAETFNRIFKAEQKMDFWSLANAFGFSYAAPTSEKELDQLLKQPGRLLIEVKI